MSVDAKTLTVFLAKLSVDAGEMAKYFKAAENDFDAYLKDLKLLPGGKKAALKQAVKTRNPKPVEAELKKEQIGSISAIFKGFALTVVYSS